MTRFRLQYLRTGAWLCVPTLAYLSLVPDYVQVRTSAPGYLEHAVAYFGTAMLFALGYAQRRLMITLVLIGYAFILEALQNFSPGRESRISDALASSTGAILGVLFVIWIVNRYWALTSRPTNEGKA